MDRKNISRYMLYAVVAVLAIGAAYTVFLYITKPSPIELSLNKRDTPQQKLHPSPVSPMEKKIIYLYFKDKDAFFLVAEAREQVYPDDPILLGKTIIESLIKGPEQGLSPTLPQDTGLRAFYIAEDGTAYVDLTENIQASHPGGAATELITLYSVVNSLALNIPIIKQVKILINGKESMTLAGHIDIRNPFKANMLMIR
jgi:spore germination protein GerM